eukprot:6198354-Pleurochrysis_carterae.AAC.3
MLSGWQEQPARYLSCDRLMRERASHPRLGIEVSSHVGETLSKQTAGWIVVPRPRIAFRSAQAFACACIQRIRWSLALLLPSIKVKPRWA